MIHDIYISTARGFLVLGALGAAWGIVALVVLLWREFTAAPDATEDDSGCHPDSRNPNP